MEVTNKPSFLVDGSGHIGIGRTYSYLSDDESSPIVLKRNIDSNKDETIGVLILMSPEKIKENKERMEKLYKNIQALEEELVRRMKKTK